MSDALVYLAGYEAHDPLPQTVEAALATDRTAVVTWRTAREAAQEIERLVGRGGQMPDVVLMRGEGLVEAAQAIRTAAPAAQLTFLADWSERSRLQAELRSASLGHGWSFALPEAQTLVETIRDSIAASGHRRLVRTTLDRRNVQIVSREMTAQRVRDLAISDALLGAIMRDAVDAIVVTDERGRIVTANPSAMQLFGFGEELLRLQITELVPDCPDLATVAGRQAELRAKAKDGTEIPLDATVSGVTVGANHGGWAVVARDARQRIATHAELQRQAELTATIVEGIAEGVYVIDAFGNLLLMNSAAEELLGWKRDELAKRNVHDTIHPGTDAGECPLLLTVRRGVPLRTQETFVRKDGTEVPVECAVTPVRLHGAVVGGVFSFHDLTAYRVAHEQLRAEKEALSQLNRVKDDFIATVSHELRTPLTAILGWLQLVSRGESNAAEMSEALGVIESSARAQAQIVEDLLDVSRIMSGKLHLNIAPIAIGDVVNAATSTLQPSAKEKGIELKVTDGAAGTLVAGDPGRLNQILWNLLSNAIKFTPAGGSVTVSLDKSDTHVRISVSDTGIGIPPETLPNIFDPYRQAEGSTSRGGLGLGLAIVRTLVDLHHGRIHVESELHRGTTFTVELPRTLETAMA